jgi:hypothetical protein
VIVCGLVVVVCGLVWATAATCGAAAMNAGTTAMAPEATTTGAAIPARCAAICTVEGRLCRPLAFWLLLGCAPRLTNLPQSESAPCYSATRLSPGPTFSFIEQHDRTFATLGYK